MAQLVDSNTQKLEMKQVIKIAAENTKSEYSFDQVFMAIMKELTLPGSIVVQLGNTVFIAHRSPEDPGTAEMRALNADTAQNFLTNCEQFAKIAYDKYNIDTISSQYTDPTLNNIWAYVGRNRPANMGYNIKKTADGKTFRATAMLGQPKVGAQ